MGVLFSESVPAYWHLSFESRCNPGQAAMNNGRGCLLHGTDQEIRRVFKITSGLVMSCVYNRFALFVGCSLSRH